MAEFEPQDHGRAPIDSDAHPHTHGHDHDVGFVSGWTGWRSDPARLAVVAAVAVLAVATLVAVVLLWPDGSGRRAVVDTADEIGFATEQVTASVIEVSDAVCSFAGDDETPRCRTFSFEITVGSERGEVVVLPELSLEFAQNVPPIGVGDDVILNYEPETGTYFYADQDRRGSLILLAALFGAVVIALARWRGLLALVAMAATVVVLVGFVAPSVLDGNDPLAVSVVAAAVIAYVSLYLTHGITPSTSVALLSTLVALLLTLALSAVFFALAGFTGLATEEASILPLLATDIDLSSLLLGGAVLGALGALDDVTVTQVATVGELRRQRPDLAWTALARAGIRIGQAHIASTVNTLLLAYAGAGIPLLLLFAASDQSLGLVANSEIVAVEIVRTMCGSIGLVAAVPIATGLAAVIVTRPSESTPDRVDPVSPARSSEPAATGTAPEPLVRPRPSWDDFGPDREFWDDE